SASPLCLPDDRPPCAGPGRLGAKNATIPSSAGPRREIGPDPTAGRFPSYGSPAGGGPPGSSQPRAPPEEPPVSKAHAVRQWILIGLLGGAVAASAAAISQRSNDYAFFDPLIDVKAMIDQLYVEEFDRDKLQEGAIRGMLD